MVKQNSAKAWLLAARPKTLTAASIPVMLGCALANMYGHFQTVPAILCFLFAFLMQIDANFINDLYDYLKGTDREDRLGPERACAQGWISPAGMKKGIAITTILAALTGICLLFYSGWEMIPVGIACIIFAFLYTTGPYPLAYHGWGDLMVLVFFGFIPVGCTYYVMAHDWNMSVTIASLASGLVIDTLLMVNNFRDREQDAVSGKRTIVVRLGAKAGLILYFLLGLAACWCCFHFITEGKLWAAVAPQLYLIPHIMSTLKMARIGKGKELNAILGETSRNMLLFGLLLTLGMVM
ncbi:1,4-dihydroxy-2-naphthoate polyprenyltransferase [uncultured Bacteroides sp.]|uniref:1,4-dihydroxy-2-naphthoate polyprenyltransferase n=1 Tax=Bacteroides ilei TaxID=1907658 RepID=UPI00280ABD0E|nr:1,4-dihydroxy-2-naphthoate polyprenyltransferase [uncultured Bacteroides sp.]